MMSKNLAKRIIFVLFVILLMFPIGKTVFELKEGIMFHAHENACAHAYWGRWDNFVIWNSFSWCVFEIFYNITFFFVYKKQRPALLSTLNKISLVLAILVFVFYASLMILLIPIVSVAYYVVKLIYVIATITNRFKLKKLNNGIA